MRILIAGPSGSGKTTLLQSLIYLKEPSSGEIYMFDGLVALGAELDSAP